MAKIKIKYICSNCGYESLRWLGKCPECDSWNSFTEEIIEKSKRDPALFSGNVEVNKISEAGTEDDERINTGITEFDRVLGGGIVPGSVILLGGDPGIGKSTLALQAAAVINTKVLFVTGEESAQQLKLRASRLKLLANELFILAETHMSPIFKAINQLQPSLVIIDSIQTMYRGEYENSPGTITQIRECTSLLMQEAKKNNFSVIIIGHVTKEGIIAGPKLLEHMVDTVLQFEGEAHHSYRILRAIKNRFGSTNELGIFEMHEDGLKEVTNASEYFLSGRNRNHSGSVITSSIEGTKPILLEVQALVTPSNYGYPQRVSTGFDQKRLSILLAVLEKRSGLKLSTHNVFINIAGGVRIFEPAVDLAVCCSIVSNLKDFPVDNNIVIFGEVGLGGEIRNVSHPEKRIKEVEKLGFKRVIVPAENGNSTFSSKKVKIEPVTNLTEAIKRVSE